MQMANPVDRQAAVLVGEYNYGRFPLGASWPRAVVPVLNRPQLWHVLKRLAEAGFGVAAICGNGSTGRIREELAGLPLPAIELAWIDGPSPRGAAGCIRDAYDALDADKPLFVAEGSLHLRDGDDLRSPSGQSSGLRMFYGHELDEQGSQTGAARPAGTYWAWPDIVRHIPALGFYDLKQQLLPKLRDAGTDVRMESAGRLRPRIDSLPAYLDVNYSLLVEAELNPSLPESLGWRWIPEVDVWADGDCRVDPSAQFAGPVLLGRGARIEADCVVVGPTVIGAGTIVERGSYVRDSVLWQRVRVGQDSELTGILAVDGVEIADGTAADYTAFVDWDLDVRQAHAWRMAGFSPAPRDWFGRAKGAPARGAATAVGA